MENKKIKYLLIGGNGFLGRGLRMQLDIKGLDYVVVDRQADSLEPCQFIQMDIGSEHENIDILIDLMGRSETVVLLASQIGAQLFNTTPVSGYLENARILDTCVEAIRRSDNFDMQVVWYSTSEIYGRDFCGYGQPNINYDDSRSLYSQLKLAGETIFKDMLKNEEIGSLKIFRPFNITGYGQRRGVVYDMIKSAIQSKTITYSDDTYRTLTPLEFASSLALNYMESHERLVVADIVDKTCVTSMYQLAVSVAEYFIDSLEVNFVKYQPDAHVRKRAFNIGSEYQKDKIMTMIADVENGMQR